MRKAPILSAIFIICALMHGAIAAKNCKPHTCNTSAANDMLYQYGFASQISGSGLCYFCENSDGGDDECASDIQVAKLDSPVTRRVVSIWKCKDGWADADQWVQQSVTDICDASPIKTRGIANSVEFISNKRNQKSITATDPVAFAYGNDFCFWIECDTGKKQTAAGNQCIDENIGEKCTYKTLTGQEQIGTTQQHKCDTRAAVYDNIVSDITDGNLAPDGQCNATCGEDGWTITILDDTSCVFGYKASADNKQCIPDNTNPATKCTNSGGKIDSRECKCDAAKGLQQTSDKTACECKSADNEYDAATGKCKIKDTVADKKACEKISDATWNEDDLKCICNDKTLDFDRKQKKCIKNAQADLCEKIGPNEAKFNEVSRQCECLDPNKEINAKTQKCEETAAAKTAREKKENQQKVKDKILDTRDAMKKITDKLDTSVWKNKEGNFNTARLASDSIAGVVLGTAGGLIVSHVVKKNQVKHGFEKLNCSIGGQTVASFGDEFSVGISAQ